MSLHPLENDSVLLLIVSYMSVMFIAMSNYLSYDNSIYQSPLIRFDATPPRHIRVIPDYLINLVQVIN